MTVEVINVVLVVGGLVLAALFFVINSSKTRQELRYKRKIKKMVRSGSNRFLQINISDNADFKRFTEKELGCVWVISSSKTNEKIGQVYELKSWQR